MRQRRWAFACVLLMACGGGEREDNNNANSNANENQNDNQNSNTQDCGNGAIDSGEQCDGANLNEQTCVDFGFTQGQLACGADCQVDTSGCSGGPCDGVDCSGHGTCEVVGGSASCICDPIGYQIFYRPSTGTNDYGLGIHTEDTGAVMTPCSIEESEWHHLALIQHGSEIRWYIDGAPQPVMSPSPDINSAQNDLLIGTPWANHGDTANMYLDEIRISKGIARWTMDFANSLPTESY